MHATITSAADAALRTYGTREAHEITDDVFYEALGAVPPVYCAGGFWLGEAYTSDMDGREVALQFWTEEGEHALRYFCRYSRIGDMLPPIGRLLPFIPMTRLVCSNTLGAEGGAGCR